MRRTSTAKNEKTTGDVWQEMTPEGKFIILNVACSFLAKEYEQSLHIASTDVSYVANTCLFESNILRYRALASFSLFRHALDEKGDFVENFKLLVQAIASLHNAVRIYEAIEFENVIEVSHYGLALSNYTLGYIHSQFAKELCDTRISHITEF